MMHEVKARKKVRGIDPDQLEIIKSDHYIQSFNVPWEEQKMIFNEVKREIVETDGLRSMTINLLKRYKEDAAIQIAILIMIGNLMEQGRREGIFEADRRDDEQGEEVIN